MASRFLGFCVFQVFQDFSATFFTMILVRGGGHFSILKAKQSSETPPCLELRPPHEGKFASKNTPNGGGPQAFFSLLLFFRVFSFFKIFCSRFEPQFRISRPQSLAWFSISTSSFVKWKSFILLLNHPNKKKKLFIS